jgi:hypothetical protein
MSTKSGKIGTNVTGFEILCPQLELLPLFTLFEAPFLLASSLIFLV